MPTNEVIATLFATRNMFASVWVTRSIPLEEKILQCFK